MARNDARLLSVPDPRTVGSTVGEMERKATPVTEAVFCPECGVRVLPFDLKLNFCFKCNTVLDSARKESTGPRYDSLTLC